MRKIVLLWAVSVALWHRHCWAFRRTHRCAGYLEHLLGRRASQQLRGVTRCRFKERALFQFFDQNDTITAVLIGLRDDK